MAKKRGDREVSDKAKAKLLDKIFDTLDNDDVSWDSAGQRLFARWVDKEIAKLYFQ